MISIRPGYYYTRDNRKAKVLAVMDEGLNGQFAVAYADGHSWTVFTDTGEEYIGQPGRNDLMGGVQ